MRLIKRNLPAEIFNIFFESKICYCCSFIISGCGSLCTRYNGRASDGRVGQITNQLKATVISAATVSVDRSMFGLDIGLSTKY